MRFVRFLFVVVFCVGIFLIGTYISDPLFRMFRSDSPEIVLFEEQNPPTDIQHMPDLATPLAVKKIVDLSLKPSIDTDNPQNKENLYKKTRQEILDTYASGKRDRITVQSFLYLASLENNVAQYDSAGQEWCQKNESECSNSRNVATFSGVVLDDKKKPIVGATVFVSGSEKHSTTTGKDGSYKLSFTTLNPRRIRIVVRHPDFAGGAYTVVTLDPTLTNEQEQLFSKDFTLTSAVQNIVLNTSAKKIVSGPAKLEKEGYLITNDFSKYLIPFESIRTEDKKPYRGLVSVRVFEFDRETANEFLSSDVFDEVYGFASEGLITYSMPLIFFYDSAGKRLEVFPDVPMTVWTTNRELEALIESMSVRSSMPGFNPADYDEGTSPENVAKKIKLDELKAYEESQKTPLAYPITHSWLLENYSRLPGFYVIDQSTGLWQNTGYSLVAPSTATQHSIKAHFWTKK